MLSSTYRIRQASRPPTDLLNDAWWADAESADVADFHPESTDHRPLTRARLLWSDTGLYGRFDVEDRYVLTRYTEPQSMVCNDSCVEMFFQPTGESGYLNFEFNAIGCILAYYITDATRIDKGFACYRPLEANELKQIRVQTTLQSPTASEVSGPLSWSLAFEIAWPLVQGVVPAFAVGSAQSRCNFFKCAGDSSHPHWASWAPIGEELNFHQPKRFGHLRYLKSEEAS